jgi:sec-independent protein translocase protein TatA
MLSDLKGWEFLILAGLVVLLFGGKRLPDAARGLGRSLRIFKAETRSLREDDETAATTTVQQVTPAPVLPQTQPVQTQPPVPTPAPQAQPVQPQAQPVQPQAQPVQQAPEAAEH